jgi:UDP-glucuronate 4-epimerase
MLSLRADVIESADNLPARRKVVLVTGGAGFIGSHTSLALLKRGDKVVIIDEMNNYYDPRLKVANLDMLTSMFSEDQCKFYEGDICNAQLLSSIFETERITHVCHLAARAGVRASIEDPYIYVHR